MEDTREYTYRGKYRYRIKSTGASSARYGNCEVCNQFVPDVHIQVEQKAYLDEGAAAWTQHDCKTVFGHEQCLLTVRRQ